MTAPAPATAQPNTAKDALLTVRDLQMHIFTARAVVRAVDGVSFEARPRRTLGLVGESGSGKSMTLSSLLGLLPPGGKVVGGEMLYRGTDLVNVSPNERRLFRGKEIALIPQDPLSSLNPVLTVKAQVEAPLKVHGTPRGERKARVLELLSLVGLPAPQTMLDRLPHQLSGGMRQRVVSAVALAAGPKLLLADEPTTSLDATIQLQFLALLRSLQERLGLSLIFVTHDFAVVARICDEVAVMYAGRIVERGQVRDILDSPQHPYTQGLLASLPELVAKGERLTPIPGRPPRPGEDIVGCRFAARCPAVMARCRTEYPPVVNLEAGREVACWLHVDGGK